MNTAFLKDLEEADMVLIGLGEEFNNIKSISDRENYNRQFDKVEKSAFPWLMPLVNNSFVDNSGLMVQLDKLAGLLQNKNYFILSTALNSCIHEVQWKEHRLVEPCGGCDMLQCEKNCNEKLQEASAQTKRDIMELITQNDMLDNSFEEQLKQLLGTCSQCGAMNVFNNVFTNEYNETGYMKGWELYTKWLTGTLNKKLLILELGVGLQFPSVIRFPFERIAMINQKSKYYRVNDKLPMLDEKLSEKGVSIQQDAIDWIESL